MVLRPSGKWEMTWKNSDSSYIHHPENGTWSGKKRTVLKLVKMGNDPEKSGWFWNRPENEKIIRKNPDIFDTVRIMGNDLEISGQLWNCLENGKWSRKIRMVLKPFGKWEMTWKNPGSLSGFSVIRAKKFQVAMLLCYPGFSDSGYFTCVRFLRASGLQLLSLLLQYQH